MLKTFSRIDVPSFIFMVITETKTSWRYRSEGCLNMSCNDFIIIYVIAIGSCRVARTKDIPASKQQWAFSLVETYHWLVSRVAWIQRTLLHQDKLKVFTDQDCVHVIFFFILHSFLPLIYHWQGQMLLEITRPKNKINMHLKLIHRILQ